LVATELAVIDAMVIVQEGTANSVNIESSKDLAAHFIMRVKLKSANYSMTRFMSDVTIMMV